MKEKALEILQILGFSWSDIKNRDLNNIIKIIESAHDEGYEENETYTKIKVRKELEKIDEIFEGCNILDPDNMLEPVINKIKEFVD